MIQTKEDREFEKRFYDIKKIAETKQKSLPESFKVDEVDEGIYYALFWLFLTFRYGAYTDEEYKKRAVNLLAKYKTRKSMIKRQFEMYREAHERAMRCSQIETQLLKSDNLGYKETFDLFFEYIGTLRNDCIARRLKEKFFKASLPKEFETYESKLMTKDLGYKEAFNLLFEYIGTLRTPGIAGLLKRKVGYSLITGCKNFTDEELEQLEKEYSSSKGKEKNKQCLTA